MPSKTLIESANRFRAIGHVREFGLRVEKAQFDAGEIIARKRRLDRRIRRLPARATERRRLRFRSRNRDVPRHEFYARKRLWRDPRRPLTARSFLIATGSEINFPGYPRFGRRRLPDQRRRARASQPSPSLSSSSEPDRSLWNWLTTSTPSARASPLCNAARNCSRASTRTPPAWWKRVSASAA